MRSNANGVGDSGGGLAAAVIIAPVVIVVAVLLWSTFIWLVVHAWPFLLVLVVLAISVFVKLNNKRKAGLVDIYTETDE